MSNLDLHAMVEMLKAASQATRLRILAALSHGDLTVSDLTRILGQSQPRVSRHLKLLQEAGFIIRYQEGAWAYFRLTDDKIHMTIIHSILNHLNHSDHMLENDQHRLVQVKQERNAHAASYFSMNAAQWDKLRLLHVSDQAVEAAMKSIVGKQRFQAMLDIGTGTASMLKLFADMYVRGIGVDNNRDMLSVARSNLDQAGITHAQVRQGDITALPVDRESFDLVTIHQVLHFLNDPQAAIEQVARVMRPNGTLIIVDFASHDLEFLRSNHAHLRLGFSDQQIQNWIKKAGLEFIKSLEFKPNDQQNGLTVKLWLAKDPRLLIAKTATSLTA